MYPDKIFGLFNLYGVMIVIGVFSCLWVLGFLAKRQGIKKDFIDYVQTTAIISVFVGILSAALFQSFYDFIENPSDGFRFNGGMTFIGGLIGGVVVFLVIYQFFKKRFENNLFQIISIVPVCILIAHGFGRLGCFFAGCCYGVETDAWYGVVFKGMAHKVVPTNLFEAIFLFIMFGITFFLVYKKNFKYNFPLYLICYGTWRFIIEFFRGDDRGKFLFSISPSQFWSLLMIVISVPLFIYLKKKNDKLKSLNSESDVISTNEDSKTEEIEKNS